MVAREKEEVPCPVDFSMSDLNNWVLLLRLLILRIVLARNWDLVDKFL
jgi:hypothetical protein